MPKSLPPIHPGETLREDVLDPLNMSVNQPARALCVDSARLNEIARGRRGITAKDQKGFKGSRVQNIIESCGAFVGVIPNRDSISAFATENPYKYFLTELDFATKADLPTLAIADPRVRRSDGEDYNWIRMETEASESPAEKAIGALWERWSPPPRPHDIFLAIDLATPSSQRDSALRQLVERVTGMRTIVGSEVREADLQSAIMRTIKQAFLVLADLSGIADDSFNLDVCIEAGMALASGTEIALVARGKSRSPPFMLRRAGQADNLHK